MKIETIYPDGSGAPALVTVKGWTFRLDFLGEVKCSLLTESSSRKPAPWMAEWARKTYLAELTAKAPPGWFELSKALYGVP